MFTFKILKIVMLPHNYGIIMSAWAWISSNIIHTEILPGTQIIFYLCILKSCFHYLWGRITVGDLDNICIVVQYSPSDMARCLFIGDISGFWNAAFWTGHWGHYTLQRFPHRNIFPNLSQTNCDLLKVQDKLLLSPEYYFVAHERCNNLWKLKCFAQFKELWFFRISVTKTYLHDHKNCQRQTYQRDRNLEKKQPFSSKQKLEILLLQEENLSHQAHSLICERIMSPVDNA